MWIRKSQRIPDEVRVLGHKAFGVIEFVESLWVKLFGFLHGSVRALVFTDANVCRYKIFLLPQLYA